MPQLDPVLVQVAERIRARQSGGVHAPPDSVLDWAKRYRRIEGRPFNLDRFRPLEQIYLDDHPRIVVKKPAQRGISEWAVSFTCFALEHGARLWANGQKNGLNVGYLFPVKQNLEDFAKERINELRDESTHLATMFSDEDFDSLGFKRVANSHLYMRGTYAKSGLLSFPADVIIFDEFDQMDARAVSLATRRMSASSVRRDIRISTPTFPGRGISAEYLASDQRIYETQCRDGCQEWVSFDFFRDVSCDNAPFDEWKHWDQAHVAQTNVTLHCPKCNVEIADDVRCADGRWVVQNPTHTRTHGYQVPWWPFPMTDIAAYAYSAVSDIPSEIEELYHSDLGLEYGAGGGSVTEDMLQQLTADYPTDVHTVWRNTTMGADIGARMHFKITSEDALGRICVRAMGSVDDWEGLHRLMMRFQVRMAIVDALPELHDAVSFCERWRGRAKRAFYPTNANALRGQLYHEIPNTFDIQINRTMAMDAVLASITNGQEHLPLSIAHDPEIIAHMGAPTRVKTEDANGQPYPTWVHTSPDHGFHSWVYDLIARKTMPTSETPLPVVGGGQRVVLNNYQKYAAEKRIEQMRSS